MWIEHTEYDEGVVHHQYRPLIRSGLGFGAQKWISTLQRHCECMATIMSPDSATDDHSPGGFPLSIFTPLFLFSHYLYTL